MPPLRPRGPGLRHLRQQAPGRVPYYDWLFVQGVDDLGGVVGDLLEGLLGEDAAVRPGLFDRCRIVWPVGRSGA